MLRSFCALAAALLLAAGCEKPATPPAASTAPPAGTANGSGAADDADDETAPAAGTSSSLDADDADAIEEESADDETRVALAPDALDDEELVEEDMDEEEAVEEDELAADEEEAELDEEGAEESEEDELASADETEEDETEEGDEGDPAEEEEGDEAAEGDAPKTLNDFVREAQEKAQTGDLDGAGAVLKEAVEALPDDPIALATYCNFSFRIGQQQIETGEEEAGYAKLLAAGENARKLLTMEGADDNLKQLAGYCLYFEATAHGHAEDADKAIASLTEAFENGFDDMDTLLGQKELAFLKDNADFQALTADLVAKAEQAAIDEAKTLLADNEPFPVEFELTSIEGEPVTFEGLKGKVAIVDFWGTWCPPCRKEIPHFIELQDKYKDQGLTILGINCNEQGDVEEQTATVQAYIEENKINYTCALSDGAVENRIPNLQGYPTTLFVDRAGTVRGVIVGYHSLPKLEAIVKELLAEPAPEEGSEEPAAETEAAVETEEDAETEAASDDDAAAEETETEDAQEE